MLLKCQRQFSNSRRKWIGKNNILVRIIVLIHGVKEVKNEKNDESVLNIIKNNLDQEVDIIEIDRSHRILKVSTKSRTINK